MTTCAVRRCSSRCGSRCDSCERVARPLPACGGIGQMADACTGGAIERPGSHGCGTPRDITPDEPGIELFCPADARGDALLSALDAALPA